MDLEQIFQNAGTSMDAQNITLLLLSLLAQFGSSKKVNKTNRTKNTEEDPDVLLVHNISFMLMKYYEFDPAFWDVVVANLEEEEIRRKEQANRRLSPATSTVLISVYVTL